MFDKSFALEGGELVGKSTITKMMMEYCTRNDVAFATTSYYNNEFGFAAMRLGLQPTQQGKEYKLRLIRHSVEWNIKNIILPAFEKNQLVIHDRCFLSTMVYNYLMEDKDPMIAFDEYSNLFHDYQIPIPHIMLIDVPSDAVAFRLALKQHKDDSYEEQGIDFHKRILEYYRKTVDCFESHSVIVNEPFKTQTEIAALLDEYFSK